MSSMHPRDLLGTANFVVTVRGLPFAGWQSVKPRRGEDAELRDDISRVAASEGGPVISLRP